MEGSSKFLDGIYRLPPQKKPDIVVQPSVRSRHRGYLAFILVVLIFVFSGLLFILNANNLANAILTHAQAGENYLNLAQDAIDNKNIDLAISEFGQAKNEFRLADQIFTKSGQKSSYLINFKKTKNKLIEGQKLINSAYQISDLGQSLLSEINPLLDLENLKNLNLAQESNNIANDFSKILKTLNESKYQIQDVSFISTDSLINKISQAQNNIETFEKIFQQFPQIAGQDREKNYLLLFQNTAEARPSGGFLGNYGMLTVQSGKITDLKIDDIYALKWEYNKGKDIEFPVYDPLSFVTSSFRIHEGNWNSNFPTSASRMESLFQQYSKKNTDGVIAVDPKLFEDILEILGPIEMPEYNLTLDHDHFREQVQYVVEIDNPFKKEGDLTANPKKILQDFTPLFLNRIKQATWEQKTAIVEKLFQNLSQKHILLYSENVDTQNLLSYFNWSGELKDYSRDFLLVSNSNISGTKSSLRIKQKIQMTVNILSDGTIINDVEVTHNGLDLVVLMTSRDKSYIQILVPQNSELIDVKYDGADIPKKDIFQYNEDSKISFGYNNFLVYPGEEKKINFRYKLPFKATDNFNFYSLLAQKQPGTLNDEILIKINLADNLRVKDLTSSDLKTFSDGVYYQGNLENDRFFGLIFE